MQSPEKIIVLGTGGNSRDILDTINEINSILPRPLYECLGLLDDDPSDWGKVIAGVTVLGPLSAAEDFRHACFVNGIGSPENFWKKESIISKTALPIERFETIVHPSASISKTAQLGRGTVIFQNVVVTSGADIGNHVIILPNTVVSHDVVIGDYTCIAGGVCISGGATIGRSCYLGSNSAVIQNIVIGNDSLLGMGSVVLEDVEENSVVVGNPARLLRQTR